MTYGPYKAVVTGWHDGDTCHMDVDLGFGIHSTAINCRVFGINAPELATEAGKASLVYVDTLCPAGTAVTVTSHGWDKFGGRFDGEITLPGGASLAQHMLDAGYAVPMAG